MVVDLASVAMGLQNFAIMNGNYLEIVRKQEGSSVRFRFPIEKDRCRVGRGLRNDLLLFHPDVRETEGVLELRKGHPYWVAEYSSLAVDCAKNPVALGPYLLRARKKRFS